MTIKDYYKILEVSPASSASAIKKAYRRLAHKYHPDKNGGNKLYEQKFKEINEAYHILLDSKKRNDYNYSRSGDQHVHSKSYAEPETARSLLLQAKKLKTKISAADPDRVNKEMIFHQVERLLSGHNLRLIKETHDEKVSEEFVESILIICQNLPYSNVQKIIPTLVALAGTHNDLLVAILAFDKKIKYRSLWNEYKILVALLITFLFCLLIYLIST